MFARPLKVATEEAYPPPASNIIFDSFLKFKLPLAVFRGLNATRFFNINNITIL